MFKFAFGQAPLAWRALHFKEQLGDHLRFGKLEACAEMCGQAKDNMQDIMEDCLGELLGSLTVPLEDSKGRKRRFDPAKTLQDLITKLLACAELPGSVVRDLSTLDTALQTDESRLPARKELEALREDASYVGVLKPVLHSEGWPALLEHFDGKECKAGFAAELMEAFAAFNDCGFAVANVEVVDRLNNALLAAMGESQSEVELVLKGLDLVSQEAVGKLQEEVASFCKEVCKGNLVNLALVYEREEALLRRGIWECPKFIPKNEPVALVLKSLRSRAEDLRKYAGLMEEVAKLEQASRNVQVPEADDDARQKALEQWATLKSTQQTRDRSWPITVSQAITAFLEHRRRAEATPEMYRQQAATLQAAVSSLLDSLAEGLAGCQPEAFAEKVKTVRELKHVTMQVCALSDTPVFARSWVELACGPLLQVCEALRKEPFPEEHLSEDLLRNAEALTEAEDSRVKLDAALPPTADSQRQIVSFLSAVTAALGGWKQAFNARKEKAELEFEQAADSLRSKVNATFEAKADWLSKATPGNEVKMALKKLAKAEAALSSVSSKSLKLRATTDLKEQAKVHIVAWGALTLFLDPAIKQVGSKGDSLRRALCLIFGHSMATTKACFLPLGRMWRKRS